MMRLSAVLFTMVFATSCTSQVTEQETETLLKQAKAKCVSFGYHENDSRFPECVRTVYQQDSKQLQADKINRRRRIGAAISEAGNGIANNNKTVTCRSRNDGFGNITSVCN